MFRAIISPILRSIRLCVTACGIMHRRCCRLVTSIHVVNEVFGAVAAFIVRMGEIIARNMLS